MRYVVIGGLSPWKRATGLRHSGSSLWGLWVKHVHLTLDRTPNSTIPDLRVWSVIANHLTSLLLYLCGPSCFNERERLVYDLSRPTWNLTTLWFRGLHLLVENPINANLNVSHAFGDILKMTLNDSGERIWQLSLIYLSLLAPFSGGPLSFRVMPRSTTPIND